MNKNTPITLIQLTDTHLFSSDSSHLLDIYTRKSFTDTVDMLLEQEKTIDQVLVTGDISQDYTPESYQFCKDAMERIGAPYAWLCGNHDEAAELKDSPYADFFPRKVDLGDWLLVLLNSQVPGETPGELAPEEIAFMEQVLSDNPDTPTLIAFHHHPLCISSPWMDSMPLKNGQELMERLKKHPQVKVIIHGHIHQERETCVNGIHILSTPSTSVQFAPHTEDFLADMKQPGYRKISLYPDGSFETKVCRLPEGTWIPDQTKSGY